MRLSYPKHWCVNQHVYFSDHNYIKEMTDNYIFGGNYSGIFFLAFYEIHQKSAIPFFNEL